MEGKKKWYRKPWVWIVVVLALLPLIFGCAMCVVVVGEVATTVATEESPISLADDFGCQWIMTEYRSGQQFGLGHDGGILQVSNAMNLKRVDDMTFYVGVGDAERAVEECQRRQ